VLGVLDVTGDHRSYHRHTMALVTLGVCMIENHWLGDDLRHAMRLHFHSRPECIGTLMEGILAVDDGGRFVGANRSALDQLGLSAVGLRMHSVDSLFGIAPGALIDRLRAPGTPVVLHTHDGRRFGVHARLNAPALRRAAAPPAAPAGPALDELQAGDAQVQAVVARLRRVLDGGLPLVITGETGSGKHTLAQALHRASARAARPFVVLRCTGLADADAQAALQAALDEAQDGTLLLDALGELSTAAQGSCLRVLGNTPAAPQLICTHRCPLAGCVAEGRLREDLFHRLNGLAVHLPPLRERTDLLALARRLLGDGLLTPAAQRMLAAHTWPGNLRELGHTLRSAALLAGAGQPIDVQHLPEALHRAPAPPERSLQDLERDAIEQAVRAAGGNISAAAKRLGVSRNTIYRKLRSPPAV
jgi:transcriptional regulator of acetoin/glycerol metabolism